MKFFLLFSIFICTLFAGTDTLLRDDLTDKGRTFLLKASIEF